MRKAAGFTLIEIIIVISLVATVYFVALPQFNLVTGTDVAVKLGQLAADIRSGYDTAVLSGKTHRLVFTLATGEYWLEVADRNDPLLGDDKLARDPTEEEEQIARDEFTERFKMFEDLAGQEIMDPETEKPIKPTSPVLEARKVLEPIKWARVEGLEWRPRSIGPYLLIQDMQAEHHAQKQTFEELGEKARAFLYFFPQGYVERAVIHVAYKRGNLEVDTDQEPYTIISSPLDGTAEVVAGMVELAERDNVL